jgi:hypothetical protein
MRMIRYVFRFRYRVNSDSPKLNLQMVAGLTFPYYSESRITFNPTYKFDLNNDTYDTS